MVTLFLAIFVASLLGSFHCVCMCGPIAIWNSAAGSKDAASSRADSWQAAKRMTAYHLGRLLTYTILGATAGWIGQTMSQLGEMAGIQSAAARIAGAVMIAMGLKRLWTILHSKGQGRGVTSAVPNGPTPNIVYKVTFSQRIAGTIASVRPHLAKLTPFYRSLGIGAVTVLLPCGWLYLFVIFAAGTGAVVPAMAVMTAFWLGTLPSLTALVLGALQARAANGLGLPKLVPLLGALVLIIFGTHTATGRAAADLKSFESRISAKLGHARTSIEMVQSSQHQPLPCCQGHAVP